MDTLLQTFDAPFTGPEGELYDVQLYGRSRPGDTWQGWIVFARRDGTTYATDVETTQSSADGVLYWASGLSSTFFDGAFERARRAHRTTRSTVSVPPPLRDASAYAATYLERLTTLERDILRCFTDRAATQLATQHVFDTLPHANADVVRAIEALEKQSRYLVRRTEDGNDWLILTEDGTVAAGVTDVPHTHDVTDTAPR